MDDNRILYNAIRTPDGTLLCSEALGICREHVQADGKRYSVDGGLDNLLRYHEQDYEELSLRVSDGHQKIRESLQIEFPIMLGEENGAKILKDAPSELIQKTLSDYPALPAQIILVLKNEQEYRQNS